MKDGLADEHGREQLDGVRHRHRDRGLDTHEERAAVLGAKQVHLARLPLVDVTGGAQRERGALGVEELHLQP
ncbi:hypothetical protein [Cystobacter fuscus]|uniref:hypothetical protein n=1 Tax=Cystobacter fuscus TaxID=43 RepID=UPI0037C009FD